MIYMAISFIIFYYSGFLSGIHTFAHIEGARLNASPLSAHISPSDIRGCLD